MDQKKDEKLHLQNTSIPDWKLDMCRKFLDRSVFGSSFGVFCFSSPPKEDQTVFSKDSKSLSSMASTRLENSSSEVIFLYKGSLQKKINCVEISTQFFFFFFFLKASLINQSEHIREIFTILGSMYETSFTQNQNN